MNRFESQYLGCFLGLATGDALGAPFEGGLLERLIWRLIGKTRDGCLRWTDDTQMALDLAESLLANGSLFQNDLATRFAQSYRWSRGYGPSTAKLLKCVCGGADWRSAARKIYPDGSFGNGAAMRAPILALFFTDSLDALVENTRSASQVTHSHPIGVDGAVLLAVATRQLLARQAVPEVLKTVAACCQTSEILSPLKEATSWLEDGSSAPAREVAERLGNGMTAQKSCVTALYIALRFLEKDFNAMMTFIIACHGDVDTIGSMAGALWGVYNGCQQLPLVKLEQRELIENTARRLADFAQASASNISGQPSIKANL